MKIPLPQDTSTTVPCGDGWGRRGAGSDAGGGRELPSGTGQQLASNNAARAPHPARGLEVAEGHLELSLWAGEAHQAERLRRVRGGVGKESGAAAQAWGTRKGGTRRCFGVERAPAWRQPRS